MLYSINDISEKSGVKKSVIQDIVGVFLKQNSEQEDEKLTNEMIEIIQEVLIARKTGHTDKEILALIEQNSTHKQRLEIIHGKLIEQVRGMESLLDTLEVSEKEEITQDLHMMFWGL